jgi:membrane fusion protein (multidrug efflux system)
MRRLTPFLVLLGALLLAFIGYRMFFSSKAPDAASGGAMPPTLVEAVRVKLSNLSNQFETVATLRSQESISIRPEIAGRIDKIHFAEGQQVAAGALLFSLDDALTRADLNEANANLLNSERAAKRASELASKQLIAKSALDLVRAELSVNQARAASARAHLEKTQIRAPFAGVTGLRRVSQGDFVTVGQEMVPLVKLNPIEVQMRVPEVVLSSLAVGQQVEFGVDAFREEIFSATVIAIAPTVDAGGRSVELRASLDNPGQRLRPGMSARARITLSKQARALLVPEQAIWPSGDQKMVYLVVDGVAKLVPVTLGARQPGSVEVTSGIKEGDQVVTAGQLKLHDGAKVNVKPAESAPAAPTAPAAD